MTRLVSSSMAQTIKKMIKLVPFEKNDFEKLISWIDSEELHGFKINPSKTSTTEVNGNILTSINMRTKKV